MACGGCMGARRAMVASARRADIHGMANAARMAGRVILDKARGTYDDSRYVGTTARGQPVQKATPYRRPVERST